MFPASSFGKWETVMIVEEMEGEGVPKSDAAMSNEAQVEPLEKKGKFEVSSLKQLFPFSSELTRLSEACSSSLLQAPGYISHYHIQCFSQTVCGPVALWVPGLDTLWFSFIACF